MKILLTILACAVLCSCAQNAVTETGKDIETLLKEAPGRTGNLHHCYEEPEHIYDTPAPRGFKPFYVTHYGRHGSRYLNNMSSYDKTLAVLVPMQEKGILTATGDSLVNAISILRELHKGMTGFLTQKGGRELYGIGRRLAERYPAVFSDKDRQQILCASSPVQRCIQSMGYFSLGLKGVHQDLDITLLSGEKIREYIYRPNNMKPYFVIGQKIATQTLNEIYDPSETLKKLFNDPTDLEKHLDGGSAQEFLWEIFAAGDNFDCFDREAPSVLDFYAEEDMYVLWKVNNIRSFNATCSSIQNERYRPRWMGSALLKDFVRKADEAVNGNGRCADFRFGHDAVLGPFLSFIRLEGFDMHIDMKDAPKHWRGFERLCMGTNIQMVFYKNRHAQVLVKLLHNEKETCIPSLDSYHGPYYRWEDLKNYFTALIEEEALWEAELKAAPDYVDIENLY